MVFDRDGALVFADSFRETASSGAAGYLTHLRRVDGSGMIRTVAGDLTPLRAFNAAEIGRHLSIPLDARIATGPDFSIFVAGGGANPNTTQNWVGRIDANDRFTWLAGGWPIVGIPNRRTALLQPAGLAVGPDGLLYVSNTGTSQIFAIAPNGTVTIVAGTGERGASGDGGPATSATFFAPASIRFAPDGSLHIVDMSNHRVRAIDHGGNVVTVAGDGAQGYSGDGASATRARLAFPADIAFAPDGVMYIADSGNARVRAVARDGTITTVAGPDTLVRPIALAVDPAGTLYIADGGSHRILKLTRPAVGR